MWVSQLDGALEIGRVKDIPGKHHAIIKDWIRRDEKNLIPLPTTKKSRYQNFEGRKRDYAEIERLERQKLQDDLKDVWPADVEASEQATGANIKH